MRAILLTTATVLISSCGTQPSKEQNSSSLASPPTTEGSVFQGYVNSAFEVTVDGEKYNDMEDFYTKELARLPKKVATAGYDASWSVAFDAQVGMSDLWQNMKVYVSPIQNRGYQGEATVGTGGAFSVDLPSSATDSEYKVRAIKRIGVVLSKENEKIRICYNFSALEKSVLLSDREKPIILDTFISALTSYDCQFAESGGIQIPTSRTTTASALKLKKGASKDDAVNVFGVKELFVENSTRWCWAKKDGKAEVCSQVSYEKCQCYIEFDATGKVSYQQNIRADLLDLTTW